MSDRHEYRVVPAPSRAARTKGLRSTADRFAHTLTEALNDLAMDGWEFLRTETLTVEERKGLFGRRTVSQTMLVFRRARPAPATAAAMVLGPRVAAPPPPAPPPQPAMTAPPPMAELRAEPRAEQRAEPLFRPGALTRTEPARRFPPLRRDADGPDPAIGGGEPR